MLQEPEFLNNAQETNRKHLAQVVHVIPVNVSFIIKKKLLNSKKVNEHKSWSHNPEAFSLSVLGNAILDYSFANMPAGIVPIILLFQA